MISSSMRSVAATFALTLMLSACGGSDGSGQGAAPQGSTPNTGATNPPANTTPPDTGTPTPPANDPAPPPANPPAPPPATPPVTPPAKSAKRGVAYDMADPLDFAALAPGVSWWYNWGSQPNKMVPSDYIAQYGLDYFPMLWNGNYSATTIEAFLKANTTIKYLLVINEPNLTDQSNLTPQQAAAIWPGFETIAADTGVKIVGPQITWGTMAGYADPVTWMDAFIAAYQAANGGRSPRIDYLAFHWYDYGLSGQLDRLTKYGKPFWVTEFANWHTGDGTAAIDTLAKQEAQMTDMVATCESRSDVFRYAWFTGRIQNDVHFTSLLGTPGQLTDLGKLYLSLPYTAQ
jgi:hypothetical protein